MNPACAIFAATLLLPLGALAQGAAPGSSTETGGAPEARTVVRAACAHRWWCPTGGIRRERAAEAPSERVEARINQLHAELEITATQEEQWNAFAQDVHRFAAAFQPSYISFSQEQKHTADEVFR